MKKQNRFYTIIIWAILLLLSLVFLYPLVNILSKSLMTYKETLELPPRLFPAVPQWQNFYNALKEAGEYNGISYMLIYLKNSLVVVVSVIIGGTLSASMCAYGFSKVEFKGRDTIFYIVLSTMMIPQAVLLIPQFIIFMGFGWKNSLLPLTVPLFFGGGAISIFLLRQFMRTLPRELNESAKIDGAGHWLTFSKIIMPLCKPVIMVLVVQYFLGAWNDLMGPLIYTNTPDKWTLALGIANMAKGSIGLHKGMHYLMANSLIMICFPLVIFIMGQRFFIEGVVITGIKA